MGMLFVTNTNDFHHTDKFDGEEYHFPPGEKVAVSEDAATHMFGRNLVDKTNALQRLGWAMAYDPDTGTFSANDEGVKKLAKFVFTPAVLVEGSSAHAQPELA